MHPLEWLQALGLGGAPHWHLILTVLLAALLLTSEILSLTKRTKAKGVVQAIANVIVQRWGRDIPWIGGLVTFFATVDDALQSTGALPRSPPPNDEASSLNVIRELINFFRMQAGIIFASQTSDPALPAGVAAFWHNATADRFRLQDGAGLVGDVLVSAPVPANTSRGAVATDYRFELPAGVSGNLDFLLPETGEIVDLVLHKSVANGGGDGTIQLVNPTAGAAISDAMSINVAVGSIIRPQLINNGPNVVAAGTALRFVRTRTASTDESVVAYIRTLRRA